MNNFDDWSQIISKYLKSESGPLGSLAKHGLEGDAVRTAFIRSVLDRFLPETYGVGSGQIMDCNGNMSGKIDIIVYRRDFPRLDLPGSSDIYLYESVIATFEVVAKLVKKTFFEALDSCASLAELNPDIDHKAMASLAARNQLTLNANKQYVHPEPVRTARFHLIGRPLSFIYAFSGYKTSSNMMIETLEAWLSDRKENHKPVDMKSLPAVIATEGCFAWRNSAPYTVNESCLMGVGKDDAPVRLIILQMLHTLSRKLRVTADSFGLKPTLDGYLSRMPTPQIDQYIGKALNPVVGNALNQRRPFKKNIVTKKPVSPAVAKLVAKSVAKAPITPVVQNIAKKPADEPKTLTTLNPKPEAVDAPFPMPNGDLIPELDPDPPEFEEAETEAPLPTLSMKDVEPSIPPKRVEPVKDDTVVEPEMSAKRPVSMPVDIELHDETLKVKQGSVRAEDSAHSFLKTVKIPAPGLQTEVEIEPKPESNPKTAASVSSAANEFIETVKMSMAAPEPFPDMQPKSEPEPEPFTATIPQ